MWRRVAGRSGQAENREVVAFGRAAREDHVAARAADDRGDPIARLFDGGPGAPAELVRAAAGVAEVVVEVAQHLGADPRIERRRRGAIEIDGHRRHHHAPERGRACAQAPKNSLRATGRCSSPSKPESRGFSAVLAGRPGPSSSSAGAAGVDRGDPRGVSGRRRRVLRRFSGGGAVVLGPGCLNYAVALSLVSRPELADVAASFECSWAIVAALGSRGCRLPGTDLALDGRKVSGNAQRRGRRALLHHGTLLYDFDPAGDALPEGACPPARLPRGPAPRGVPRQPPARPRDCARQAGDGMGRAHALHENSWRAVKARPAAYCKKTRRLRCAETARRTNEDVTNSQHPTSNSQPPARARGESLGGWQLAVGS